MHQEPEMIYEKRQRQTMTSSAASIRTSGGRLDCGGVIRDLVGFALMELVSPVAGLAVFVVTFCAAALGVACDLAGYGMSALNGTARKTKR